MVEQWDDDGAFEEKANIDVGLGDLTERDLSLIHISEPTRPY